MNEIQRERRTVTILFCDLTGFTTLTEGHDPERVQNVVSSYFEKMRDVIHSHGGTLEKFIGDAIMAVFGYPEAHGDDALRAVHAACDMRSTLEEHNPHLDAEWGVTLSASVGIDTGEVVAGAAGPDQPFVTGDAVNTAARLEQQAAPGEILIGHRTWDLVQDAAVAETPRELSLKGKSRVTVAWPVLSVDEPSAEHVLQGRMLGRERQLEELKRCWSSAAANRDPACAIVVGDPGVGKTTLVTAFLEGARARAPIATGRCRAYGRDTGFLPLIEILRSLLGITIADDHATIATRVRSCLGNDEAKEFVEGTILRVLGVEGGEAISTDDVLDAIRALLIRRSDRTTPILVLEDIQAASPALLASLFRFVNTPSPVPLAVIGTAREEHPEALDELLSASVLIRLGPLSDVDARSLLSSSPVLQGHEAAVDRVLAASGGNPLFLQEFVRMLEDRERVTSAFDLAQLEVPATVEGVIRARLDALPAEAAEILRRAAVIGKDLPAMLFEAVVGERSEDVKVLLDRGFIERTDGSTGYGFTFTHESIRDVVYSSILKQTRVDLHGQIAELISADGSLEAEVDELVGFHLEKMVLYRRELGPETDDDRATATRAGGHLYRAGVRKADVFQDVSAAASLLERALALLPAGHGDRFDASVRAAWACLEAGREREASRWRQAAGSEITTPEQRARFDVEALEMDLQKVWAGVLESGSELESRALSLIHRYESDEDLRNLARAWGVLAVIHSLVDGGPDPTIAIERSILYEDAAGTGAESDRWNLVGLAAALAWGPRPVDEAKRKVLELRARIGDLQPQRSFVDCYVGILTGFEGDPGKGRSLIEQGLAQQAELGLHNAVANAAHCRGALTMYSGDLDSALDIYLEASHHMEKIGDPLGVAQHLAHAGHILFSKGDRERSREMLERGRAVPVIPPLEKVFLDLLEARLLAAEGDTGAVALAERSMELMANHSWCEYADAHLHLADVYRKAGRFEDARGAARRARKMFESKQSVLRIKAADELLGELDVEETASA